jgi:DNA polymerase I-like protein with 3'-5' exonuclease and polymerase domains
LIVEVAQGEEDDVHRRTEAALTEAAGLNVPLTVSMATGASWAAAKG